MHLLFLVIAMLVVIADQLTKTWIRSFDEGQVIFQAGFFSFINVYNTGAAFGILQDKSFYLTITAFIGIIIILLYVFFVSHRSTFFKGWLSELALGLIFGGTIGNLTDRLRFGQVTDFISVSIWPTFNIADSSLTIGILLFAYLFLSTAKTEKQSLPELTKESNQHANNL